MHDSQSICNKIEIPLNKHVAMLVQDDCLLNDNDLEKLNSIYLTSLIFLDVTLHKIQSLIKALEHNPLTHLSHHIHQKNNYLLHNLRRHFSIKTDDTTDNFRKILQDLYEKLLKTKEGLYAGKSKLYLSNVSKKCNKSVAGYVNILKYPTSMSLENVIHLNLQFLDGHHELLIATLIHEASHMFANSEDYNLSYITFDNYLEKVNKSTENITRARKVCYPPEKLLLMPAPQRINHADSLCNFVFDIGRHEPQVVKADLNVRFPERNIIHTNINLLFSEKKHRVEEIEFENKVRMLSYLCV